MLKKASLILISFLFLQTGKAQSFFESAETFNKKRTIGISAVCATGWVGSISGLYFVWYKDFPKTDFHTFDDSHEWNQMDKMGHWTVAWHMARTSGDLFQWSGIDHKTAAIIGSSYSFAYMTTFELLDATNEAWGFSWSDVGFNALGTMTYGVQEYFWDKQFFKIKFSAHHSGLAEFRPDVLGSDPTSRMLKDYNGQTYWASFNPVQWFAPDTKFPKWICLSIGYGTENQLYGDGSTYVTTSSGGQQSYVPYRQMYLSLDIDFEELPVNSKWLKMILRGVNVIKLPFPTLEISQGALQFHPFYF